MKEPVSLPGVRSAPWDRSQLIVGALMAMFALGLGRYAWYASGGNPDEVSPAVAAWAIFCATFVISFVHVRVAVGGRLVELLALRAGFPKRVMLLFYKSGWRSVLLGALLALIASAAVFLPLPNWALAVALLIVTAPLLSLLLGVVCRLAMVAKARRFIGALPTAKLAEISAERGDIELALRVPSDAPTFALPFLRGEWAAVQVTIDSGKLVKAWPERLQVEDESGRAELELASFALSGWRLRHGVSTWTEEELPEMLRRLEDAVGEDLTSGRSALRWYVWALAPGDPIYVVGDATEVRTGFGAYRGDGATTLSSDSGDRAVAYLGDERELDAALAREFVRQALIGLVTAATLVPVAWVVAIAWANL